MKKYIERKKKLKGILEIFNFYYIFLNMFYPLLQFIIFFIIHSLFVGIFVRNIQ